MNMYYFWNQKRKRRTQNKKQREQALLRLILPLWRRCYFPLGFPQYRTFTSRSDNLWVDVNEMPVCHEGGGYWLQELPLGPGATLPGQGRGALDRGSGVNTGAEPAVIHSFCCSGLWGNGEIAICQRLAVPMGTSLSKTKQRGEAATHQYWLLPKGFMCYHKATG